MENLVWQVIAWIVAFAWFQSNGQAQLRVKLRRVNCRCTPESFSGRERWSMRKERKWGMVRNYG